MASEEAACVTTVTMTLGKEKTMKEEEQVEMLCEWGACNYKTCDMDEFCSHAWEHLQQHLPAEDGQQVVRGDFTCLWQECGFSSLESAAELTRHVYFHCYHTKLKQWGQRALEGQTDLGPCLLDYQTRNLVPDIPENLYCLWENCQMSFENTELFYRHVDVHSSSADYSVADKENRMILCLWKECYGSAKTRGKLREHLRSHTQEKVISCPTCGGMFANKTKFFDHIRRQTALDQQRFQCSHCSKRFATERLLRDHMRNHVNYYKCPLCDMTCPMPSSLQNHIRFRHSEGRPYKCQECDYSCKNLVDLRKHMDTHSKEPTYVCEFENCSFSARSLCSIKAHYKKVHQGDLEPRYKCHICERCFTRGNNLSVHLRKKHQFKWPSGHPRFRYKAHEDGFMRLQLVRYESMELTEQLMEDREKQGLDLDTSSECLVMTEGEGNLQGIILEPVRRTEPVEAATAEAPTLQDPPPDKDWTPGDLPPNAELSQKSPTCQLFKQDHSKSGPSCSTPTKPGIGGSAMEVEENVFDRFQRTANELGIHIV